MGRNAVGKKPMTPAERQRRRRKRLKTERNTEVRKKLAAKARDERILAPQPTRPRSQGQTCGPGPVARKPPRFPAFCAGRGWARDRERPIIAGKAA